jgi:high-affinity iron transporter
MVFVLALAFQLKAQTVISGAILGLATGLGISYGVNRLGQRISLRTFFSFFGILLLIFSSALISDGTEDYQQLHWLPGGRNVLWNTGRYLHQSGFIGDILHTFVGYTQSPNALQVALYSAFLAVSIFLYVRPLGRA